MKYPDTVSRTTLCAVIDEWIVGKHAERNRQIMKRRCIDGICLEPLAEEFELSHTQIKAIVRKCEGIILQHI